MCVHVHVCVCTTQIYTEDTPKIRSHRPIDNLKETSTLEFVNTRENVAVLTVAMFKVPESNQ